MIHLQHSDQGGQRMNTPLVGRHNASPYDADNPEGGQWVTTWASDVAPCDLLRMGGDLYQVSTRDYPESPEPRFTIWLPDRSSFTLGKLDRIEIWDANGAVRARIGKAPDWRPMP